jgi:CDP-diacylglycerol--glycerol-3-phosphate 3-phosphatidyltransferase
MKIEISITAGALALSLVSMAAYRMTPAGGGSVRDTTKRGGSFVLGLWVRDWFYWVTGPILRASIALRLSPVFYNVLGLLFGFAGLAAFATGRLAAGGALVLASGLADVMDGQVARARGLASKAGAFLDSTLDRFVEFATFIGLSIFYRAGLPVAAVVVALGGSMLVSYARARGESLGVLCKEGLMQRAERMLLLGLGGIIDPALSELLGRAPGTVLFWIIVVIGVGTVLTAVSRTIWILRKLGEDGSR